ncbi:hypothetical protein BBK36DRAFT_1169175 [Trichoderma citrinoviride]|uniref:Proteophosphoglycan 5 n=1 Tax=Trichoderma citrinoviride TaxID=58853 RepID=A0A2T4BBC7_9HYPO|nr:hypothetical protein BBK36DRAFT_1169175 [Trichoderma citrinoviride]PTB66588.1 hypothetical protein BBK36DRAFT_1169175 [Trichoderma citrinoviride]
MEARASPDKATPGRRRQGRGRPAPLKAYASENDAVNYASSSHTGHHGHRKNPQTPKKTFSISPVPAEGYSAQPGSKQRSRNNKPKPKHDPTSPNYQLSNNQSPPQTSPASKAAASTPFAGATFHASPAPSDLPIPSFLKSNSESSPMVRKPRGVVPQPSPPATDSEAPTPQRPVSASQHRESPLDFMFRAHRLEKAARGQFDQPAGPASLLAGVMSPPHHTDTPPSQAASGPAQNRRAYNSQSSGDNEIFELEGTGGQPLGPAFSTPYQDRIKAARSMATNPHASQRSPLPSANASATMEDPTEALKRFLFAPQSSAPTAPAAASPPAFPFPQQPRNAEQFPNRQVDGSASSIQAMENDLRRILKLDVGGERPPTERRLFTG